MTAVCVWCCGLILSSNILLLLFKKIIIVVSPVHKVWSMLRLRFLILGGLYLRYVESCV